MNETLDSLKLQKGLYVAKMSFLANDGLILFTKKNEQDEVFFTKIVFEGILGFHDTGLVRSRLDYVDIGPLGFKYMSYSRAHNQDPINFNQIAFISNNNGTRVELIIACKSVNVMQV
jgi:hypothetical protein